MKKYILLSILILTIILSGCTNKNNQVNYDSIVNICNEAVKHKQYTEVEYYDNEELSTTIYNNCILNIMESYNDNHNQINYCNLLKSQIYIDTWSLILTVKDLCIIDNISKNKTYINQCTLSDHKDSCILFLAYSSLTDNDCKLLENFEDIKFCKDNLPVNKQTNYVSIKYRSDKVDVSSFEYLNTSKSSNVRWAWYDKYNNYMIINLDWTNYHYCRLPDNIRNKFKLAESFWTYYISYIKWNYDCRLWWLPSYK